MAAALPDVECFNIGLGAASETREMQVSVSTPSSSFLPMTRLHRSEWPQSAATTGRPLPLRRLDDVLAGRPLEEPLAAKIDVQGFEADVIRGAAMTLGRCDVVVIETSFVPLYTGQPLFEEIRRMMADLGFRYGGALDMYRHAVDGNVIQEDALFLREAAWQALCDRQTAEGGRP